ncbi:MAG TPA: aspartate-semialdehyde dehydrogenase [Candidatus Micrarchaeia archaeon]|nr:aspartate-semialdehyde dehydrogenase [Candidatus Micrarchaeia archaeon]
MAEAEPGRDRLTVAVVGATGVVGRTLLQLLEERRFPVGELRCLASARSAGRVELTFAGRAHPVRLAEPAALVGCHLALFSAGAQVAVTLAPAAAARGTAVVDNSSAFRRDEDVPLVVPEVNGARLDGGPRLVANPNCSTIQLTVALAPLHRAFGLRRVHVATYQAASGGGRRLVEALRRQSAAVARGERPTAVDSPHPLAGNVVPGGWGVDGDATEEERKVVYETRRLLDLPALAIGCTTVRVPVAVGHAEAVWAAFERPVSPREARAVLAAAPGVVVHDDLERDRYPTPLEAAGTDPVWVGRLREDLGEPGALSLFVVADNLRKGAALNAVQIAERLCGAGVAAGR